MTIPFSRIPVGSNFEFRGRRYRKLALSMACDEERIGNVFHDETEVLLDGDALPPVAGPIAGPRPPRSSGVRRPWTPRA